MRLLTAAACPVLFACLDSCLTHHVDTAPIEVKPIHVTVDVNVRVQRELEEFFDFEKQVDPNARNPALDKNPIPAPEKKE